MSAAEKTTHPFLDKKLVNAFIEGMTKTLETMANSKSIVGQAFVEKKFTSKGDISGIIGMVSGEMNGNITMTFQAETIYLILENMLGETYTELTDEVADAVGEMTNMIYGTAKTTLNQMGFNFNMAIPTVIRGKHEITSFHKGATLVIPFRLENQDKEFFIEITVEA